MHEYLMNLQIAYSPAFIGSSAIRCFKDNNAIKIHDRMTFDFYTGLPHVCITVYVKFFEFLVISQDGLHSQN